MRFSIAKNFCPSCGSNLLSDAVFGEINAINKKLQSQEFMINLSGQLNKDLVQNLIYDLSIFFKFELEKVYRAEVGYTSTSTEGFEEPSSRDESDRDDEQSGGETEQEKPRLVHKPVSRAQSLSEIRSEVKREVLSEIQSEDEDEDDDMDSSDEDVDDRVKRLKKLYDTSPTLKKVFKGVSRIE
jgi:hypothetical protein